MTLIDKLLITLRRDKQFQRNWHYLYLSIFGPHYHCRPRMDIRKNSFDFLWMGFQITYRYFGNGIVCGTNMKVKDYDKVLSQKQLIDSVISTGSQSSNQDEKK